MLFRTCGGAANRNSLRLAPPGCSPPSTRPPLALHPHRTARSSSSLPLQDSLLRAQCPSSSPRPPCSLSSRHSPPSSPSRRPTPTTTCAPRSALLGLVRARTDSAGSASQRQPPAHERGGPDGRELPPLLQLRLLALLPRHELTHLHTCARSTMTAALPIARRPCAPEPPSRKVRPTC